MHDRVKMANQMAGAQERQEELKTKEISREVK
jgi:hypothetical protein